MGAESFIIEARGETAHKAFSTAVQESLYLYGHSGYSGTIGEKDSFIEIALPEGADPEVQAERLINKDDEVIADKWGPAGCFTLGEGQFLFFGWASS